jgi:hypothetical protein
MPTQTGSSSKRRAVSDAKNSQPPAKTQKQSSGESVDSNQQNADHQSLNAASTAKESSGNDQGDEDRKVRL